MSSANDISGIVEAWQPQIVEMRRQFHAHPELAFEEYETASKVAAFLEKLGIPCKTGIGGTGVVGMLDSGRPGPTIAIRAELDALPILEKTDLPFASTVPGKMHACGHDAHSAVLLGVAGVLSELTHQFSGRVALVFQPAEETLSGAAAMIEAGVLEDINADAFLGFHNSPNLATGTIGWRPKAAMAAANTVDLVIRGAAAHGAHPNLGIDAVVVAAEFINQVQTIISREVSPMSPAVFTIGRIVGGDARNIIAASVELNATVRTVDDAVSEMIKAAAYRVLEGLKIGMRIDYDMKWTHSTPVLENDAKILSSVVRSLRTHMDADHLTEIPMPTMGSEDFAWFAKKVPAAHLNIGSKIDGYDTAPHRENFTVNEAFMPVAMKALTLATLDLLSGTVDQA